MSNGVCSIEVCASRRNNREIYHGQSATRRRKGRAFVFHKRIRVAESSPPAFVPSNLANPRTAAPLIYLFDSFHFRAFLPVYPERASRSQRTLSTQQSSPPTARPQNNRATPRTLSGQHRPGAPDQSGIRNAARNPRIRAAITHSPTAVAAVTIDNSMI